MGIKIINIAPYLMLLTISGCYAISPYSKPDIPRPGELSDAEKKEIETDGWRNIKAPVFVTVPMAREYAREVQDAYRDKIVTLSDERLLTNSALIGIAASALGIAATGGATSAISALGISGAGVSAIGNQLPNSVQKQIYTQGELALECVINASNISMKPRPSIGKVKKLIKDFSDWKKDAKDFFIENEKNKGISCKTQDSKLEDKISQSENEIDDLTQILEMSDPRGQTLLSAVEKIRFSVDDELSKAEPNLIAFNSALKDQLSSAASGFINVTPSINDQPKKDKTPDPSFFHLSDGQCDNLNKYDNLNNRYISLNEQYTSIDTGAQTLIEPLDFTACQLAKPLGNGPLRAESSVNKFSKEVISNIALVIRGGTPPYNTDNNLWPENVTVSKGSALKDGQIFQISIDNIGTKVNKSFVLVFTDNSGATAPVTFLIEESK